MHRLRPKMVQTSDKMVQTKSFDLREYSQNLQHHLWDRESGYRRRSFRHPLPNLAYEREFHKCITPNLTIQNVDKPINYLRKFTPDGRLLLCFSPEQRCLEIYDYHGVTSVGSMLQGKTTECITATDQSLDSLYIRQNIFDRLFTLRRSIPLAPDSSARFQLNREFSIFLEDGRYVLMAAVGVNSEVPNTEDQLIYPDLYENCEKHAYIFYLIDLKVCRPKDVLTYRHDNIVLSHNNGVTAHGPTIAILSRYRQAIDLIELKDGKLVRLGTIGPKGFGLDEPYFRQLTEDQYHPLGIMPLSHLKQVILSYIYRMIVKIEDKQMRLKAIHDFYKLFRQYEKLILTKVQLISSDHFFLKYEDPPTRARVADPNRRPDNKEIKLFVFYCISTGEVLKICPKNSVELLYLLRDYCDNFRNVRSLQTGRPPSSTSNNVYFKTSFNNAINAIPGGPSEAALRFNATLPISTQSFATTIYLDFNLFKYDDRLISALERPKMGSQEPIRFSDRKTNITKFRLFLEPPSSSNPNNVNRDLVAFVYHPYEPFFISMQKISTRYIVNFHIYNPKTVVRP